MNRCKEIHPQTGSQCILEAHPDKPNEHMINEVRNAPVPMETIEDEIEASLRWAATRVRICKERHSGSGADRCVIEELNICGIARTLIRLHGVLAARENQKPRLIGVE